MTSSLPPLQLGVSSQNHAIARAFAAHYQSPAKRQQTYLNTLAVSLVNDYFQGLNLPTDLENSATWQPQAQLFEDIAELLIPGWGTVACRPVLADAKACYIPPREQDGILAIQFDPDFRYATFVGFVSGIPAQVTQIPLSDFQDFDLFLEQIAQAVREPLINRLGDWLTGTIDASWEQLDRLLGVQPTLAPVRSYPPCVERGKIFALEEGGAPVALVVWVEQTPKQDLNIAVELWPINEEHCLPDALELKLLEPFSGETMVQAQARGSERLRFKFTGERGDRFDVKVSHNGHSMVEPFMI
ncbi:MAG: DUF1822 family protein [Spirulina sp. SIO3F2]|nr:DUF1822 family protein [Spirulina sp. SIO3F2]